MKYPLLAYYIIKCDDRNILVVYRRNDTHMAIMQQRRFDGDVWAIWDKRNPRHKKAKQSYGEFYKEYLQKKLKLVPLEYVL